MNENWRCVSIKWELFVPPPLPSTQLSLPFTTCKCHTCSVPPPPTETGLTSRNCGGRILIPEIAQAYILACVIIREGRFWPSVILFISHTLYPDQFICCVRDLWCDISLVSIKLSEDATLMSVICNPEDLSTKLWQTKLKFSASRKHGNETA